MSDELIRVRFWGVRGTVPTPGPATSRYGGNTLCVELRLGRHVVILDAGTGLRSLGEALQQAGLPSELYLFVTHHHWDHIQGLPLFSPLYVPGQRLVLAGPGLPSQSFRELLTGQIDGIHFPLRFGDVRSDLSFVELHEGTHDVSGLSVCCHPLRHPGPTLGYVFRHARGTVAYITDNEVVTPASSEPDEDLIELIRGADLLIHDACYTDEEYAGREGWGHPPLSAVVDLAERAEVKRLALFHHDPEHDDEALDRFQQAACTRLSQHGSGIACFAAREGMEIEVYRE